MSRTWSTAEAAELLGHDYRWLDNWHRRYQLVAPATVPGAGRGGHRRRWSAGDIARTAILIAIDDRAVIGGTTKSPRIAAAARALASWPCLPRWIVVTDHDVRQAATATAAARAIDARGVTTIVDVARVVPADVLQSERHHPMTTTYGNNRAIHGYVFRAGA